MAKINYNPDESAPAPEFENFAGDRLAQIIDSDEKENKKGTGRILELRWKVCEGEENAGREVFQTINYIHESAQTQAFGQRDMNSVCEAVGHEGHLDETDVLHNVPCLVTFGLSKTSKEYPEPKTEVKRVKPANAAAPAGKPAASAPAQRSAPARAASPAAKPAAGGAPWRQKQTA